jgi:hypothetical protein
MTEAASGPSTPRDPASLVIGAIAAQVIGALVTQMAPFMIGGLDGRVCRSRNAMPASSRRSSS